MKIDERVKSLFREDGKAVYVPIDHGIGGIKKGLENPSEVMRNLIDYGIDGTLMQFGMVKQTQDLFASEGAPARILALDYRQYWKIPGQNEGILDTFQSASVEQALKYNCSAVKVMMPYGLDGETTVKHVKLICSAVRAADRADMPIMIEPLPLGNCPDEFKHDHDVIANASRIAVELGADVLKIPYSGDAVRFKELVEVSKVPVTVLGGSPKDIKSVLDVTREIIDSGAKAVVFGRNVWGHSDVESVVKALSDIVHSDQLVDEIIKKYSLSGTAHTDSSYSL